MSLSPWNAMVASVAAASKLASWSTSSTMSFSNRRSNRGLCCPLSSRATVRICSSIESSWMGSGRRVVVISDNARYHHASLHAEWRHANAAAFRLHFLPPYSPNLNPIERVWKLLRRLWIHNRHFASLQGVTDVVDAQFEVWHRPNPVLRRLCSI